MSQVIPFIIHQTWKSKSMPQGMINAMNSWKNLNPDYEHRYYDDNDVMNYVNNFDCTGFNFDKNKLLTAFNKINSGAGKADIFRYLIMYNIGGVYADADTVCLKSITNNINPQNYTFVTGNDRYRYIHQWFFLCTPKHPIIKETLENSIKCVITNNPIPTFKNSNVKNIQLDYRKNNVELYTGPFVMDFSIRKLMRISLKNNYERKSHIIKINNKEYPIYLSPEDFQDKYVLMRYEDYRKDLQKLNLNYWALEPLFK